MSAAKERPILFSAPMVRALFSGAKTQTRRVVKPSVVGFVDGAPCSRIVRARLGDVEEHTEIRCPYGQPGDRLWVRETHRLFDQDSDDPNRWVAYAADCAMLEFDCVCKPTGRRDAAVVAPRWRPSIHMPRWASRLTLEITGVRVERVQDISEEDARAEGVQVLGHGWRNYLVERESEGLARAFGSARESFFSLWEFINGAESWATNPWVWVVEFRRVA